jgi:CheY-like chemotaxis protein
MKPKILLVDSCNFDLVQTACILEGEGYLVCTTHSDPTQALDKALEEKPDLIFLDYEHSGLETCQFLQANKATRDTPIIIMSTTGTNKEGTLLALKFGCIDFIDEGDKQDLVLQKLRTYLRLSKIRRICTDLCEKI